MPNPLRKNSCRNCWWFTHNKGKQGLCRRQGSKPVGKEATKRYKTCSAFEKRPTVIHQRSGRKGLESAKEVRA